MATLKSPDNLPDDTLSAVRRIATERLSDGLTTCFVEQEGVEYRVDLNGQTMTVQRVGPVPVEGNLALTTARLRHLKSLPISLCLDLTEDGLPKAELNSILSCVARNWDGTLTNPPTCISIGIATNYGRYRVSISPEEIHIKSLPSSFYLKRNTPFAFLDI